MASLDKGIQLVQGEELAAQPADRDLETLKSLLATYVTGVFDPEKIMDPELAQKLLVIRMTLLAAYNLGRKRPIKLTCGDEVRYVNNLEVNPKSLGCSFVNNGHDDLFDLGFSVEGLTKKGLKVE
jgi:hypothetical protein